MYNGESELEAFLHPYELYGYIRKLDSNHRPEPIFPGAEHSSPCWQIGKAVPWDL
jgi:hypothetical protein